MTLLGFISIEQLKPCTELYKNIPLYLYEQRDYKIIKKNILVLQDDWGNMLPIPSQYNDYFAENTVKPSY